MLCLAKKDGRLQTAINACKYNNNMYLDVTPLPDQDIVRNAIACAQSCSKIDMTDVGGNGKLTINLETNKSQTQYQRQPELEFGNT